MVKWIGVVLLGKFGVYDDSRQATVRGWNTTAQAHIIRINHPKNHRPHPTHLRPQRPPLRLPSHHATHRMVPTKRILLHRRLPRILLVPEAKPKPQRILQIQSLDPLLALRRSRTMLSLLRCLPGRKRRGSGSGIADFDAKHLCRLKQCLQLGYPLVYSLHAPLHGHHLPT